MKGSVIKKNTSSTRRLEDLQGDYEYKTKQIIHRANTKVNANVRQQVVPENQKKHWQHSADPV